MVGVAVAEHDAADAAELRAGARHRARHRAGAGVEQGHAAVLLEQVDVAAGGLALHDPHALGDELGLARRAGRPVSRVLALKAPIMRCSAPEPCGGIIPIWRAKVMLSVKASLGGSGRP